MFCIVILNQCSFQPFMCVDSAVLKHGGNSSHLPAPAFKFSSKLQISYVTIIAADITYPHTHMYISPLLGKP